MMREVLLIAKLKIIYNLASISECSDATMVHAEVALSHAPPPPPQRILLAQWNILPLSCAVKEEVDARRRDFPCRPPTEKEWKPRYLRGIIHLLSSGGAP